MTKRLVVLVPALTGRPKRWDRLRQRLEREPGLAGAFWLSWDHQAWRHVFTRPEMFARKLRAMINAEFLKVGGDRSRRAFRDGTTPCHDAARRSPENGH